MYCIFTCFFNKFYYNFFAKIQYIKGYFMIKLLKGITDLFEFKRQKIEHVYLRTLNLQKPLESS